MRRRLRLLLRFIEDTRELLKLLKGFAYEGNDDHPFKIFHDVLQKHQ